MNIIKKILFIDDQIECIEYVTSVLRNDDFNVIYAMDGEEGLKKAVSDRPDLIVLDVMMPELNGWDICDKVRSIPEIANVPIVYLTCVEGPRTLYQTHGAFETVWDEYITKPVRPKELLTVVKKLLQKSAAAGM